MMKISNQRLRNITSGRLHTTIEDVYKDLALLTGVKNIYTHEIGSLMTKIQPKLRRYVTEERFWNGKCDPKHIGVYEIPESFFNES